jgi:hypothetical protein
LPKPVKNIENNFINLDGPQINPYPSIVDPHRPQQVNGIQNNPKNPYEMDFRPQQQEVFFYNLDSY